MQNLPIDSMSYSRMRLYLTSKVMWWMKYVENTYEPARSAAMVEGSLIHRLAEDVVKDSLIQNAGVQMRPLDESMVMDKLVDYIAEEYPTITYQGASKCTPALMEKHARYVMENFVHHINGYLGMSPHRRFTHVEWPMKAYIKDATGMSFPIPFVARVDALSTEITPEGKERVTIHDWKMVKSTTDETMERNTFMYSFQQLPYWLVAREHFPNVELRVAYHFFKTTESRPQKGKIAQSAAKTVIMVPPEEEDIQAFCYLVELMLRDMRGLQGPKDTMPILLPNVYDDMKGRANWEMFKNMYQEHYL